LIVFLLFENILKTLQGIRYLVNVPPADFIQVVGGYGKIVLDDLFSPAVIRDQFSRPGLRRHRHKAVIPAGVIADKIPRVLERKKDQRAIFSAGEGSILNVIRRFLMFRATVELVTLRDSQVVEAVQ